MYSYETEKPSLFTESGTSRLLEVRDQAKKLLAEAGAFRADKIRASGDSWLTLAAIDYMVERKELVKLRDEHSCWGQYQVYTTPEVSNQ